MVGPEPFVVTTVAGLRCTVDCYDESRTHVRPTADATADLDVLRGGLRLADDGHEAKAVNVNTHLNDVRGQAYVDASIVAVRNFELFDRFGDLITSATGRQFHHAPWPPRVNPVTTP